MSLPDQLAELSDAAAYPHPCRAIEVVETHISWVVLTGDYAYKLKKPVHFPFVDFSTLERRKHFCDEELRCNRRFAPELYLDVVPVGQGPDGRLTVGSDVGVLEWAVKMRQFPARCQLDRLLEERGLDPALLVEFGRTLADRHAALPVHHGSADELDERVLAPVRDNFDDLRAFPWIEAHRDVLERGRSGAERQADRHRALLVRRLGDGSIRECHGDLHLSNMVLLDDNVTAFDCLEFNPTLRWIDRQSDVAFLFMDCLVRGRADLGYGFVDGYLDASGDYDGARLLPFYASYRSMVRAKVTALRREQAEADRKDALAQRFVRHAAWAAEWLDRRPGRLVLMCGLSASGKSTVAAQLAPRLPALRLRSDVARKVQAGLRPLEPVHDAVGSGLYSERRGDAVYDWLADVAADLLTSGEHVIVDAAFLEAERRARFIELAQRLGSPAMIVHCDAPYPVLAERIRQRQAHGRDPSDAGIDVLAHQRQDFVPPQEGTIRLDTQQPLDDAALRELQNRLAG